jgi:DNA adenine methylase
MKQTELTTTAVAKSYPGSKHSPGVYQTIINQIPPHDVFVSGFAGHCAVLTNIKKSCVSIAIDLNYKVWKYWNAQKKYVRHMGISFFDFQLNSFVLNQEGTFLYLDPPYLLHTRKNRRYYKHELTDEQHAQLIEIAKKLKCMVAISHYPCAEYDELLSHGWRKIVYQYQTRSGSMMNDALYMNYPEPTELHDYSFYGANKTVRQAFKRKLERVQKWIAGLNAPERKCIVAMIDKEYKENGDA